MTGSVTCPQALRTRARRRKKSNVYQTKEWKSKVAEFTRGKSCEWCGSKENLLAHHPYRDTPDAIYQDLYLSGCIVLCNTCHFMFHRRHKKKCPVCKEHWMDLDVDRCYLCHLAANPGMMEKIRERAEERERVRKCVLSERAEKRRALKKKHPCSYHRIGGKCGKSSITARCQYAPTKALKPAPVGCSAAVAKKAVRV